MEQRTCPFCGGVQSESRCEICGRPTLRINPKASDNRKNQHPYAENPRTNVREENPYLASIPPLRRGRIPPQCRADPP